MSENKKYYWLKLNENFFDDDTIAFLESQENGILYSNFYLKLMLKSLRNDGKLIRIVGNTLMPYDDVSLSALTGVNVDTVRCALALLLKTGAVERLETGELFISQVDEMVGSETNRAVAMRKKRLLLSDGGNNVTPKGNNVQKCYPEIEIEKEKDIEIDKKIKKPHPTEPKKIFGTYKNVRLTESQLQKLNADYGEAKTSQAIEFLSGYRQEKGYKSKEDYLSLKRWVYKALDEHRIVKKTVSGVGDNKRDYDFEAIERGLIN